MNMFYFGADAHDLNIKGNGHDLNIKGNAHSKCVYSPSIFCWIDKIVLVVSRVFCQRLSKESPFHKCIERDCAALLHFRSLPVL